MINNHIAKPPNDTPQIRKQFLTQTDLLSNIMKGLREKKMEVYGMNWMKRGWDSLFQNIDRKFGITEEILWEKIIQQRVQPNDDDFVHLADALVDLANYALFGRWFLQTVYPEQFDRLKDRISDRMEVTIEEPWTTAKGPADSRTNTKGPADSRTDTEE